MSITVKLSKAITVAGEQVSELELREPTVDDVSDLGYPFLLLQSDNGTAVDMRPKTVLKYVSRLAAVPPSSLKKLTLADLSTLQTEIMGFFGEEAETPQP